jgi:hypothetical protein
MTAAPLPTGRDERTLAIENASYRWSYLILSFGLLLDLNARILFPHKGDWDLLLLIIVAGMFCTIYQARARVVTRALVWVMIITGVVAALVAVMVTLVSRHH